MRTAPYDRAWETFSAFVGQNWPDIKRTRRVKLQKIFPGRVSKSSIDLQLYFVKLFGCRIRADDVPIDLVIFSQSLIRRTAHPTCRLVFTIGGFGTGKMKYAGLSKIHTSERDGRPAFATWLYTLGEFHVQVFWSAEGLTTNEPKEAWAPSDGKIVKFCRK